MFNKEAGSRQAIQWLLEKKDFDFFSERIGQLAGISMKESKMDLVCSRLKRRAQQLGLLSFKDYRDFLSSEAQDSLEWQIFINLLTTNKTDFFREPKHFEYIEKTFLPAWLGHNKKTLKIWSCASSTGEEPYTLAMILDRVLPHGVDYSVLATDIDTNVLAHAENGVYSKSKYHEIPKIYQDTCLCLGKGEVEPWFAIKKRLREKIVFKQHNIVSDVLPVEEKFDLVFCRNMLIYFNKETITKVAKKIYSATDNNGVLVLGHSESLQGIQSRWKTSGPSIFKK